MCCRSAPRAASNGGKLGFIVPFEIVRERPRPLLEEKLSPQVTDVVSLHSGVKTYNSASQTTTSDLAIARPPSPQGEGKVASRSGRHGSCGASQ